MLQILVAALLGLGASVRADLNDGLIAYYPFNGNANDASGNGNNGTVYNATLTMNRFGTANTAYDFNGNSSYIDIPKNSVLNNLTTNFTLSAWIYQRNAQPNGYRIIDKCTAGTPNGWTFDTCDNNTGRKVRIQGAANNGLNVVGNTEYSLMTWHHVVTTVSGPTGKVYLDGNLDGTGDVGNIPANALDIFIGRAHPNNGSGVVEWFNGIIDDVRIYNRALSDSEVQQLYSLPDTGPITFVQTNRTPTTNEIGQPTIPTSNYLKVFTNGTFHSGIALDRNKMTVVLTHGFNGSPSDWASYTAQIIQQRIGVNTVNIVAWDWTSDAQGQLSDLGRIAAKTPREGNALGTNLVAALGANYSKRIHFIGHSLGTLVNAAAANYVHTNRFSWANTQMTLCDEAEVAWTFTSVGWQMATTLPEIIQQGVSTLETFDGNFSTPQPGWANPLPNQYAWADNYVSAFGLLHSGAANVILTYTYPDSLPDVSTVVQEFYNFHDYAHFFYEDTIEPGLFNTGGAINATYAGFVCSFEGGGYAGRPATNTYFYQDPSGTELNLTQKDLAFATNFLNARFKIYQLIGVSSLASQGENGVFGAVAQAVGQVNGQIESTGQNLENMVLNFFTSVSGGSLVQNSGAHPLGGPVPNGSGSGNTPAYAWVPLNVPPNALSMSFDFMLQGNGNNDSFQVALNGTNVMSLETSLIQTNVTLNSGMIDVSQYAGQQVTLFMGIVGGTSTNAALTVSNFQFYVALPPSLQIQMAGTNVVLTWPLWAANYSLETTSTLGMINSWIVVTNAPSIVNFQCTVTNQISGGSRFYRLAIIVPPTLQAQVSGSSFVLSWPVSAQTYSLQTTTNLADANSWMSVTNTPAIVNLQCLVTNQISSGSRFYRLKK